MLKFNSVREGQFFIAFFVLIAILYLLSTGAYFVGYFNDDAFYIMGSQSLLNGRYVFLSDPLSAPNVNYTPGFPLLLTPISLFRPQSFFPYQLFSVVMTIGGLLFYFRYFQVRLSPNSLKATLFVSALVPLTVSMSGTVLSDIPFFLVTPLCLKLIDETWHEDKVTNWIPLAGLTSLTFYFRPIGAAFPLAMALALILERRWRLAISVMITAIVVIGIYFLRNHLVGGRGLPQIAEYRDRFDIEAIGNRITFYISEVFYRQMFRWPLWFGYRLTSVGTSILGMAALSFGINAIQVGKSKKFLMIFYLFICWFISGGAVPGVVIYCPYCRFLSPCFLRGSPRWKNDGFIGHGYPGLPWWHH